MTSKRAITVRKWGIDAILNLTKDNGSHYHIKTRLSCLPKNILINSIGYNPIAKSIFIHITYNTTSTTFKMPWDGNNVNKLDHIIGRGIAFTLALYNEMEE